MQSAAVGRWFDSALPSFVSNVCGSGQHARGVSVAAIASRDIGNSETAATYVYVSNADDGDISTYRLADSGELLPGARVRVAKGVMPMAVSPDRRFLYAVSRSVPYTIHVLAIDPRTGALTPASTSPLAESLPYISLDKTGRFLLGASYAASLVTVAARWRGRSRRSRAAAGDPGGPQRAFDTRRRNQPIRLCPHARQRCRLHVHLRCENRDARIEHAGGPADESGGGAAPFRHLRRQQVPVPACAK